MPLKKLPCRTLIQQLLIYNAQTGALTWLPRPREMFRSNSAFSMWNKRYANTPAGAVKATRECRIHIDDIEYRTHRIIWLLVYGEPVPEIVDHIDGDPFNNCLANLRAADRTTNLWNRRISKRNSTGIKGVHRNGRGFAAVIAANGVTHYLGYFKSLEEAAAARQEAASRLHREFARHG